MREKGKVLAGSPSRGLALLRLAGLSDLVDDGGGTEEGGTLRSAGHARLPRRPLAGLGEVANVLTCFGGHLLDVFLGQLDLHCSVLS
jgi:hypothetical protein